MSSPSLLPVLGTFHPRASAPLFAPGDIKAAAAQFRDSVHVVRDAASGAIGIGAGGSVAYGEAPGPGSFEWLATLPPLFPEWLGDRSFCEVHGVRFPYVAGEMANGIATTRMVIAMAEAEMLGMFGAGGLAFGKVEQAVDELERTLGDRAAWGVNLIHSPNESALEDRVADLLVRRGVARISASAFMGLTPAVVRCAASGLSVGHDGAIVRRHHIFAKISRAEVARHFMAPAPTEMLRALVERGLLTHGEAELAARVPIAEDITVEADSGGHTDNQSMVALLPAILALRDEMMRAHRFQRPIRVGAAGGLGTPGAVAAAFALGAAYVVTGSINQSAVEAGLSDAGKAMLAQADVADVIMAPAADMFELGVKVQVLRRGTMFGVRGAKLYEAYRDYPSLDAIPEGVRARLERDVLGTSFDAVWEDTKAFWTKRDPAEVDQAERDPKHKMALCFRWYLGKASRWAIEGEPSRRADFQIWSGPAMGSFNRWVKGTFLEAPESRTVAQLAKNLLEGAAAVTRAGQLRSYGVPVAAEAFQFRPRPLA